MKTLPKLSSYSKEELEPLVKESCSFSDLYKKIGRKSCSSTMIQNLKLVLNEFNLSYSHFGLGVKNSKYKTITKICPHCTNKFTTLEGHRDEKQTCSHTCSNFYFSKKRMTESTKSKISITLKTKSKLHVPLPILKPCIICSTPFNNPSKRFLCCSRKCGQIHQHGSPPLTKFQTIKDILTLAKTGDHQQRKAGHKLQGAAIREFGTWNKAIKFCGLTPNKSHFQKCRVPAKDGHICDSLSELTIDNFLYDNKIKHTCHKRYQRGSNYISDFYFPETKTWVEYFGLYGEDIKYTKNADLKIQFAKDNGLKLLSIFPKDLYPENNLEIIFKDYIK